MGVAGKAKGRHDLTTTVMLTTLRAVSSFERREVCCILMMLCVQSGEFGTKYLYATRNSTF